MFVRFNKTIIAACTAGLLSATLGATASHAWGFGPVVQATQAVPALKKVKASLRAGHTNQSQLLKLLELIPENQNRGFFRTGALAGAKIGDLYADYVGHYRRIIKGKSVLIPIPARMYVDWNQRLERLWARKIAMSDKTVVTDTGNMLVAEYKRLDPQRMTLGQYQTLADNETKLVYRLLKWGELCRSYELGQRKCELLKRASANVDGRTIIAYGKTEICPTSGQFCDNFLDFMLRNAGRRYLESIPALHDTITSFGTFQFTPKSIHDVGRGPLGGASKANRQLPQALQIPASMALVREDHHLRAASLFAIANLAAFIARLDNQHMLVFEGVAYAKRIDLAQFIATAHNKPQVAYRAGAKWLESKALASYRDGCPKASKMYATKTKVNYEYDTSVGGIVRVK